MFFADQIFKPPHDNIFYLGPETEGLKNNNVSYSSNSICQNCKGSVIDCIKKSHILVQFRFHYFKKTHQDIRKHSEWQMFWHDPWDNPKDLMTAAVSPPPSHWVTLKGNPVTSWIWTNQWGSQTPAPTLPCCFLAHFFSTKTIYKAAFSWQTTTWV